MSIGAGHVAPDPLAAILGFDYLDSFPLFSNDGSLGSRRSFISCCACLSGRDDLVFVSSLRDVYPKPADSRGTRSNSLVDSDNDFDVLAAVLGPGVAFFGTGQLAAEGARLLIVCSSSYACGSPRDHPRYRFPDGGGNR